MIPATRNDGLRLQLAGVEVGGLAIANAGGVAGVIVEAAAARNGPGIGMLIISPGELLAWQAPQSSIAGTPQPVGAGGSFMLEDGNDESCWLNVTVYPSYLPTAGQAQITLRDSYNNIGPADVQASVAAAGGTTTTQYTLVNVTNNRISAVTLWIDPTAAGFGQISVSSDGTNFYQPSTPTDAHVLAWSSIATGANVSVWVKRTIAPAAASNPSILNLLQWEWSAPS